MPKPTASLQAHNLIEQSLIAHQISNPTSCPPGSGVEERRDFRVIVQAYGDRATVAPVIPAMREEQI